MPTILEVMQSRIGVAEIRGADDNPVIVQWFADCGHPEVTDDETAHCSACMGSAAKEAGLPIPPHNTVLMARSWLTWGVAVKLADIEPGDVAVWPRGDPRGWQGHVNVVKEVRRKGKSVDVRCIGGNQSTGKGYDAVTLTKWTDATGALGFRRAVPATIKDLRAAGSTTIKSADNEEKIGIVATFFAPVFEGVRSVVNGIPSVSSVEGLTYLQTAGKLATGAIGYVATNPWVLSFTVAGLLIWLNSVRKKRSRVAEHAAGIPIASEVAAVQGA